MTRTSIISYLSALLGAAAVLAAGACGETTSSPPPGTPPDTSITTYSYNILHTYPHDENAYTQGLVYVDSALVEGTGWYHVYQGSTLRRVEIETGDTLQFRMMPNTRFFGEGVAVWGDTIYQLTWQDTTAVIYDKDTFDEIGRFHYPTEGWGLTHDGERFIMSDGTATLYFRDRHTFAEIGRVEVRDEIGPVTRLNELEYIDGLVYANVYLTQWIVMIDPQTGRVRGRVDLGTLGDTLRGVANGIAYDVGGDRLFVTGKLWRSLYHIELFETD